MEINKKEFELENLSYGYNNKLNNIINEEYPNLLKTNKVYLDNTAIPPLPTNLVKDIALQQCELSWIQNPHSSAEVRDRINSIRTQVLNYFKCSSKEYSVIFCNNATSAIKLVGENFPWYKCNKLILSIQNHTSMVGIREYAIKNGSKVELVNLEKVVDYNLNRNNADNSLNLICLSAQSNWNGLQLAKINCSKFRDQNTLSLIDFASYAQSNPLNITEFGADFSVISFYKMFGLMTGLSCVIAKRSSLQLLNYTYFGGGNLAACDIYSEYRELNAGCWEFGTPNYMDILNLPLCLNHLDKVFGGIENIHLHCSSLANWLKHELKKLKHFNHANVIELYSKEGFEYGPIVTFNIIRSNGTKVDLKHLESILDLNNIIVRVGSLCNPGSNQLYLGINGDQIRNSFNAGVKCGDGEVGACRVSFGKVSRFEDAWQLLQVIKNEFIEFEHTHKLQTKEDKKPAQILEINIYPIKSCQAYQIPITESWPILKTGLKWDRKFKLVNLTSMKTMVQKNYSILALFTPNFNFENGCIWLSYKGLNSPKVNFKNTDKLEVNNFVIDHKEETIILLNTPELDDWFLKFFDFKVGLATSSEEVTFPNQAPILAILEEDIEDFRLRSGTTYIPYNRFRANLILRGIRLKAGDVVKLGGCEFKVEEPCTRCSMVTIDQTSSKRDLQLYSNLIKLGSNQGFGKFGWYLKLISKNEINTFNC